MKLARVEAFDALCWGYLLFTGAGTCHILNYFHHPISTGKLENIFINQDPQTNGFQDESNR